MKNWPLTIVIIFSAILIANIIGFAIDHHIVKKKRRKIREMAIDEIAKYREKEEKENEKMD